jgi:small subunit ribosomal protein S5
MSEEKTQPEEEKVEEMALVEEVEAVAEEIASEEVKEDPNKKSLYAEKKKVARIKAVRRDKAKDEFDQRILDVARVTRVMQGGKRMSFRVCVAIGDHKGKVGIGLGKGADVTLAVNKAVTRAKKEMIDVNMVHDTIPHQIYHEKGAAKMLFKPARKGRGVIAGGIVRVILEMAGVKNVTSKILGTNNKVNNARCAIEALSMLRHVDAPVYKKEERENGDKEENKDKQTDKKIKTVKKEIKK